MFPFGSSPTKQLQLPSGHLAEVKTEFNVGEEASITDFEGSDSELGFFALSLYVKSWDFKDVNNQIVAVNRDTVRLLSKPDFNVLAESWMAFRTQDSSGLSDPEKKASPSISVPVQVEESQPDSPTTT